MRTGDGMLLSFLGAVAFVVVVFVIAYVTGAKPKRSDDL
jgi:hypothetical protein